MERRPSLFTSGPCFWRALSGHPYQELELALTGSVAPWPLTRGDGQGIPIHRLLASLRWDSAMTVTSSRPGLEVSDTGVVIILSLLLLPT